MPVFIDLTYLSSESEDEEDTPLTPTPRPYCDWGVCGDILEQIGKHVVEVRKARKRELCRIRPTYDMNREFEAIVNVLAKRNKPLTLRNMRYKYVRRDEKVRWSSLSRYDWTWRTSLEDRRKKIKQKEMMNRER